MVTGLTINKNDYDSFGMSSEICLKAKQIRFPFGSKRTKAIRPFEIIHTDLCGPIEPSTLDGKNYILDKYTHFLVVYLLRSKIEAI